MGIIIAKLVAIDVLNAKSESTPIELKRKNWSGTIINPPPIPNNPDEIPAIIPIIAKKIIYSNEKI